MRTIENYDCKIFTNNVEDTAIDQIKNLLEIPVFSKSKIRIMPDVHAGAGCVIGFTADLGDKVIPNIVGVDIGCFSGETLVRCRNKRTFMEVLVSMETLAEDYEYYQVLTVNEDAYDPDNHNSGYEWSDIRACWMTKRAHQLARIHVGDYDDVICTPDHKFLTEKGWVRADKLAQEYYDEVSLFGHTEYGDSVNTIFEGCRLFGSFESVPVYDLETISENHNFVLECGLIAHNCGMSVTRFKFPLPFYKDRDSFLIHLDEILRRDIPLGRNIHDANFYGTFKDGDYILDDYRKYKELINSLKCLRYLSGTAEQSRSMGSLGGGNHFIEIDESDQNNDLYLVIHTGSRNLGKQVADYYQKLAVKMRSGWDKVAIEQERIINEYKASGRRSEIQEAIKELHRNYKAINPNVSKDLCWLEGNERLDYLHDMRICQELAKLNRKTIKRLIDNCFHFDEVESFETIHNYIGDDNMIRKGAISCKKDEKVIIPMNMRDGSLICIGKGNEDWNNSGPHGAGRIMSRTKAFETLKLEDYQDSMKGIYTTSVTQETIDEAPMVYKPMDEIIENIRDTAEVVELIKPIYNLKAEE